MLTALLCCQVFDWYDQVGDGYLKHSQLGDNLHAAQMLQEEHVRFEMQARVCATSSLCPFWQQSLSCFSVQF